MPSYLVLLFLLFCAAGQLPAQRRVESENLHDRVYAVVPMVGTGAADDPRRPAFVPKPPVPGQTATATSADQALGFTATISDDGKWALVEIVVRDRRGLALLLADRTPGVKIFEKDKSNRDEVLLEFRKLRKDFDFNRMGVTLP